MGKAFILGEGGARIADILEVARRGLRVELSRKTAVRSRIAQARDRISESLRKGEIVYGVNTGVGTNAVFLLPEDAVERFQEGNLQQLCCGTGPSLEREIVRASMFLRALTLSLGYSAVRLEVIEQLARLLNAEITPRVPYYGSVGASGDLIPSAYVARALLGQGRVLYLGKTMPAGRALRRAGIAPLRLSYKEGLALINGTTLMTGVGALAVEDAGGVLAAFLAAAALSIEALGASPEPFDEWVQKVKGHEGQTRVAAYMRKLLAGSKALRTTAQLRRSLAQERATGSAHAVPASGAGVNKASESVQSGYSVRCIPQGIGPMYETLRDVRAVLQKEANSANDNPLVDPKTGRVYHTGNFYGGHTARAMDGLKLDLANVANWANALMAVLVDDRFSNGLPPALVAKPGLNTGFKGMQLSMTSLACAVRQISSPSSVHPLPTEQYNEDMVSLGVHAALTARDALERTRDAVSILLITACQAIDLRGAVAKLGEKTGQVYRAVRSHSKFMESDRALEDEIAALSLSIRNGALPLPGW